VIFSSVPPPPLNGMSNGGLGWSGMFLSQQLRPSILKIESITQPASHRQNSLSSQVFSTHIRKISQNIYTNYVKSTRCQRLWDQRTGRCEHGCLFEMVEAARSCLQQYEGYMWFSQWSLNLDLKWLHHVRSESSDFKE